MRGIAEDTSTVEEVVAEVASIAAEVVAEVASAADEERGLGGVHGG